MSSKKAIQDYLSLPASHRLYSAGMALYVQHVLPLGGRYAVLYPTLAAGPFPGNADTLESCLREAEGLQHIMPTPQEVEIPDAPASKVFVPKSTAAVEIMIELRHLRQKVKQTSQRFHTCETDAARAEICDILDALELDIQLGEKKLTHIQKTGQIPKDGDTAAWVIPEDETELAKVIHLIMQKVNRLQRTMEELEVLPSHDRRRAAIPDRQQSLKDNSAYLVALREKKRGMRAEARKTDSAQQKLQL